MSETASENRYPTLTAIVRGVSVRFEEWLIVKSEIRAAMVDLTRVTAENKALRKAIDEVYSFMGPITPPCCQGCHEEWTLALEVLRPLISKDHPYAAMNEKT